MENQALRQLANYCFFWRNFCTKIMTNKTKKNLRLTKYRSYGLIIIVGNDAGN